MLTSQTYAEVSWRMLTSSQTYAEVSWRMLTSQQVRLSPAMIALPSGVITMPPRFDQRSALPGYVIVIRRSVRTLHTSAVTLCVQRESEREREREIDG